MSAVSSLEVVRIYFNKLHIAPPRCGFWERLTRPPAAVWLAKEALNDGITFAAVTVGAAGFVRGARYVEPGWADVMPEALPTCLELVGHTSRIASFLEARKSLLGNAIVIRVEGEVMLCGANADPEFAHSAPPSMEITSVAAKGG